MNKKCRSVITRMLLDGNKGEKNISKSLLVLSENNSLKTDRITSISKNIEVSASSMSRYIKKSGYPSFRHFAFDFNGNDEGNYNPDNDSSDYTLSDYYTTAQQVTNKIKEGKIFIISSKRGKSIGKLMNERLNDGGFDNQLYHQMSDNLEKFINNIKGETLFLITLSGHSKIISEALSLISRIKGEKPKIIILTAGKPIAKYENAEFISIGKIKNRDYKIDDWVNYNLCVLDILTLVIFIINNLSKKRKRDWKWKEKKY